MVLLPSEEYEYRHKDGGYTFIAPSLESAKSRSKSNIIDTFKRTNGKVNTVQLYHDGSLIATFRTDGKTVTEE